MAKSLNYGVPDDVLDKYGEKLNENLFVYIKEEKEDLNLNQINVVDLNKVDSESFNKIIRYVNILALLINKCLK
jgi:hypothetical protein